MLPVFDTLRRHDHEAISEEEIGSLQIATRLYTPVRFAHHLHLVSPIAEGAHGKVGKYLLKSASWMQPLPWWLLTRMRGYGKVHVAGKIFSHIDTDEEKLRALVSERRVLRRDMRCEYIVGYYGIVPIDEVRLTPSQTHLLTAVPFSPESRCAWSSWTRLSSWCSSTSNRRLLLLVRRHRSRRRSE